MTALHYELKPKQGRDYKRTFPVLDGNDVATSVVGWSAAGQIRASYDEDAELLATLDLTLTGTNLVLRIPAATSREWTFRRARYDVELTAPDGSVIDFLEGTVVVRPKVTRLE